MTGIKAINTYLVQAISSAEFPAYTSPPGGVTKYALISNNTEADGGTKDAFIQEGTVQINVIERIKGNSGSYVRVVDRMQEILNIIKPNPQFMPAVAGVKEWEVQQILTPLKSFNGESVILMQICIINYKYTI
jgi:hypothetical protein